MDLSDPSLIKEKCLIDGAWIGAPAVEVRNPATGALIARVPDLGAAETRQAIEAAARAFPAWSRTLAKERAAILRRWYELQIAHALAAHGGGRGARRAGLRGLFHRVLRRGGQARVW
jgi:succinate-semialdehyde dehydrogenase/glutarate-semialdehyde dehydrogenase